MDKSLTLYQKKLLDPRWQKKRLEILNRDEFTCQSCGDTKSTLHVHHIKYSKSPWSINSEYLITYCDFCHQIIETLIKNNPQYKIFGIVKRPITRSNFYPILFYCFSEIDGYLTCISMFKNGNLYKSFMVVSEETLCISYNQIQKIKRLK